MPIISQVRRNGVDVKFVAGLPDRWGIAAYRELRKLMPAQPGAIAHADPARRAKAEASAADKAARYTHLCNLLDSITAGPVPVDATDAQLCMMAERFAADCATVPTMEAALGITALTMRERMEQICRIRGIEPPAEKDDAPAMARMVDPTWWRRSLRRTHGRALEHTAMRLGFVSIRVGSYCSNEAVTRRRHQVERNAAALKATMIRNHDTRQEFNLYDIAQKGMANKSIRRGELMLRMAGCESVAAELEHVGLFVTVTCPSKYHAVLQKTGSPNPKYQGATPRQAQDYLNKKVWALTRAKNAREGIAPYGFRIAEPHHDGCPHWHMLVFVPKNQAAAFVANLALYALAEDANELTTDAAREARLKVIEIDPAKGTAAGYIAKYVGKNIDDSQGEVYDEEGEVKTDLTGEEITTPCQRVDAWASVWGIRQFQGLGMPPVTVWRELRRVKENQDATPDYMRAALLACQRVLSTCADTGEVTVTHAADFGDYIRAQGGVNLGRDYRIGLATKTEPVAGRYGITERTAPVGVEARQVDPVFVGPLLLACASERFSWSRVGGAGGFPRSPLNNCTDGTSGVCDGGPEAGPCRETWFVWSGKPVDLADFEADDWDFDALDVDYDQEAAWMIETERKAHEVYAATVWTAIADERAIAARIATRRAAMAAATKG